MRTTLRATDGGFLADEDAIGFSFAAIDDSGAEHYLNLQRQPEGRPSEEDWGIYLEFDDQAYGGYGCVGACRMRRELLSVDLCKALGQHGAVEGFDVSLTGIGDQAYDEMREGLPRAFRGFEHLLTIT